MSPRRQRHLLARLALLCVALAGSGWTLAGDWASAGATTAAPARATPLVAASRLARAHRFVVARALPAHRSTVRLQDRSSPAPRTLPLYLLHRTLLI